MIFDKRIDRSLWMMLHSFDSERIIDCLNNVNAKMYDNIISVINAYNERGIVGFIDGVECYDVIEELGNTISYYVCIRYNILTLKISNFFPSSGLLDVNYELKIKFFNDDNFNNLDSSEEYLGEFSFDSSMLDDNLELQVDKYNSCYKIRKKLFKILVANKSINGEYIQSYKIRNIPRAKYLDNFFVNNKLNRLIKK